MNKFRIWERFTGTLWNLGHAWKVIKNWGTVRELPVVLRKFNIF